MLILMSEGEAGRKRLPHEVPQYVASNPEGDVFFITICCEPRGHNQLVTSQTWAAIKDTFEYRQQQGDLKIIMLLAMPDHLHGLLSFEGTQSMSRVVKSIKSWLAKKVGIN